MKEIKGYALAIISLRIIAIYLAIQVINLIPSWVSSFAALSLVSVSVSKTLIFTQILLFLANFLLPILVWVFSKKLAKFIAGDEQILVSLQLSFSEIGYLIFVGIGLLVFLITLPDLVIWTCQFFIVYYKNNAGYNIQEPSAWVLLSLLLKIVLSIILLANPVRFSILFRNFSKPSS